MPDIFEIYGWLFTVIAWIPIIAILLLVLVGVGYAIYGVGKGVGYALYFLLGLVIGVLGLGAPILVPLFIYLASIYESPWFPRLALISAILGLFIWFALIYSHYLEKEDKSKKTSQAKRLAPKTSSFSA